MENIDVSGVDEPVLKLHEPLDPTAVNLENYRGRPLRGNVV